MWSLRLRQTFASDEGRLSGKMNGRVCFRRRVDGSNPHSQNTIKHQYRMYQYIPGIMFTYLLSRISLWKHIYTSFPRSVGAYRTTRWQTVIIRWQYLFQSSPLVSDRWLNQKRTTRKSIGGIGTTLLVHCWQTFWLGFCFFGTARSNLLMCVYLWVCDLAFAFCLFLWFFFFRAYGTTWFQIGTVVQR